MCSYVKLVDELMDFCSDTTGSLRTLRQEGRLYDPGGDISAVTWCVGSHMCVLPSSVIHMFLHQTTRPTSHQSLHPFILPSVLFLFGDDSIKSCFL